MDPYLSFPGSYPSSSPPLQLPVNERHHGDVHNHFMHHSNAPMLLGLMTPEIMEVPASEPPSMTSTLSATNNNYTENNSLSPDLDRIMGKVDGLERPKAGPTKKTKKPKYAFQTRSHVDILDDGYRWRKYGQKAVKNNKFPRSYYKCTFQGCNVKKQVQRLTGDEGVVVTTYEGIHSHTIEKSTDNFEHILNQFQIYTNI